jgi:hypothetical protein
MWICDKAPEVKRNEPAVSQPPDDLLALVALAARCMPLEATKLMHLEEVLMARFTGQRICSSNKHWY